MTNTVTHFEIYGEHPVALADFYREAFGWQVEQMEGIGYWRVLSGATTVSRCANAPAVKTKKQNP